MNPEKSARSRTSPRISLCRLCTVCNNIIFSLFAGCCELREETICKRRLICDVSTSFSLIQDDRETHRNPPPQFWCSVLEDPYLCIVHAFRKTRNRMDTIVGISGHTQPSIMMSTKSKMAGTQSAAANLKETASHQEREGLNQQPTESSQQRPKQ